MCDLLTDGRDVSHDASVLTRSADTAVVMRAYGPFTRPPHTSSIPTYGKKTLLMNTHFSLYTV